MAGIYEQLTETPFIWLWKLKGIIISDIQVYEAGYATLFTLVPGGSLSHSFPL